MDVKLSKTKEIKGTKLGTCWEELAVLIFRIVLGFE